MTHHTPNPQPQHSCDSMREKSVRCATPAQTPLGNARFSMDYAPAWFTLATTLPYHTVQVQYNRPDTERVMDPCPFVRVLVGNLGLKIPVASKPAGSGVHPSSSPCFCKIRLKYFPQQTATVPLIPAEAQFPDGQQSLVAAAASFVLSKADVDRLTGKSNLFLGKNKKKPCLKIAIYTGRRGTTCGVNSGRLLGRVRVPLDDDLLLSSSSSCVFHNGWIGVGKEKEATQMHLSVRSEPDPRFVIQFEGEPECSPQVFQIQGSIRQPVFTCNFSFRSSAGADRNQSFQDKERLVRERKGWAVTVHDLSGSPVALASMVTPFVASPGSDRVSRSNPGAWLILRPGDGTWKPWGRLEAWRERGSSDGLGYRFQLLLDTNSSEGILLAESTLRTNKGGKFIIDTTTTSAAGVTPPNCLYGGGFVMSSTVQGEGKCSKPSVEVSVQHVSCTEDAAAFVALAAAIDLSMDACRLFSDKLRKELSQHQHQRHMFR